jgi:hypothetical protein
MHNLSEECRFCGSAITLASDGAWEDEAGACGCGAGEHAPGGYNEDDHAMRAKDTSWWGWFEYQSAS